MCARVISFVCIAAAAPRASEYIFIGSEPALPHWLLPARPSLRASDREIESSTSTSVSSSVSSKSDLGAVRKMERSGAALLAALSENNTLTAAAGAIAWRMFAGRIARSNQCAFPLSTYLYFFSFFFIFTTN